MSWPVVKLSEIAPAKPLKNRAIAPGEMVWHLTLDKIESNTGKITEEIILPVSKAKNSTHWFDNRHVLYSKLRPYLNKVVVPEKKGIATTELVPLMPDPQRLDRTYLAYYLRSPRFVHWISGQVTGAKMPRASMKIFWNHEIPLPPLPEQKRIAAILDKADAIRRKRQQAIKLADDFLRATFLDMFGDPVTNPKGFTERNLSEFYLNAKEGTKCGPFGSALKKHELVDSGVPVWNMDNIDPSGRSIMPFRMWITEEKYDALSAYSVCDGDIIISRAGTVGKMCIAQVANKPSIISTNLIRLRLGPELLPVYFVALMTYCKGRVGRLKTGDDGAFTHMNTGILDNLSFPYPPIFLQQQFAKVVEHVESLRDRLSEASSLKGHFFNSLTQRAFRGEL